MGEKCELEMRVCPYRSHLKWMGESDANVYDLCNNNPLLCAYRDSLTTTMRSIHTKREGEVRRARRLSGR